MMEQLELLSDVLRAMKQIESGQVFSNRDAKAELRRRLVAHVAPSSTIRRMSDTTEGQELEQSARILADQADRLVSQLAVDVSSAESFVVGSSEFCAAANAYERIALAERTADPAEWYKATFVDGRTSREIMDRLWDVREQLRHRDEARKRRS
jgi:hypothetical protein